MSRGAGDYNLALWLKFRGMKPICTAASLFSGESDSSSFKFKAENLEDFSIDNLSLLEIPEQETEGNAEVNILKLNYKQAFLKLSIYPISLKKILISFFNMI